MNDTPRLMHIVPAANGPKNLIKFNFNKDPNYEPLTSQMTEFLRAYNKSVLADETKNLTVCSNGIPRDENTACFYDAENVMTNCQASEHYGYSIGAPCIFAVFNKFNFTPERYEPDDYNNTIVPEEV